MPIEPRHVLDAAKARQLYLDNLNPQEAAADWQFAKREARKLVGNAFRESNYLNEIRTALTTDGRHALVYRQMLAPPMSQDQFKLVCPRWSKASEKDGRKVALGDAAAVEDAILSRLDRGLVRWASGTRPTCREVMVPLQVVSALIAAQRIATARRSRLAFEQEYAVVAMLEADGWTKLPSRLINKRAAVPPRFFMRKTRFATATTTPQEVDIACGLEGSYVLAMECKVTNDETNSVKRVNDVLKKANAWKTHWGSFVKTAALLEGVIAPKDVQRLSDGGVLVFWSHDLGTFRAWIATQLLGDHQN